MLAVEELLLARDVPGVTGSFLLDGDGRLLARDVPVDVADDVLVVAGRRCGAALAAARVPMPGSDQVVLRFAQLAVFSVRAGRNLLVLLAEDAAETSVVRIATRAIAARLALVERPDPPQPPDPAAPFAGPG